jgi:hypothetical protein
MIVAIITLAIMAISWYGEKQLTPSGMITNNTHSIIHPITSVNLENTTPVSS